MPIPDPQSIPPLFDNLFRHESGKLVSVLTKIFGPRNLELAEDVVQDTLLKALEHWKFHGVPDNPSAWLFTVARNKALDVVRREKYKKAFAEDYNVLLSSEYSAGGTLTHLLTENQIEDEQLRMMFVCCHPSVAEDGQVALILKTLCGFSVAEIAKAFITNEETITKRLYRAREQFRVEDVKFEIPSIAEFHARLGNVLRAIYLLFNEGYHSTSHDQFIREDLVEESLRLALMVTEFPVTRKPESLALLALLCFHSARLQSRTNDQQHLLLIKNQDRSLWNRGLITQGTQYLNEAAHGEELSRYHMEAAIAYEHCIAPRYEDTDWKKILQYYDLLYQLQPNNMVALNRAIVVAELEGPEAGLQELAKIRKSGGLENYYLLFATEGELHLRLHHPAEALQSLEKALSLTQSPAEKELLRDKLNKLNQS
jgi:RNA polymerase sigma factor (sigma-70 family)